MGVPPHVLARRPAPAPVGLAVAVSVMVTMAVLTLPFVRFAYHAPEVHVMLETVNAVVAVLVGYLVYGRFRQHRRLQELLLGLALATVAAANLVFTAVPDVLTTGAREHLTHWVPLTIRLLGTVLLAVAALTPATRRVGRRRAGLISLSALGVLVVVWAGGALWGNALTEPVDPGLVGDGSTPQLVAHPVALAAQAVGALLYGVAALAFTRQAARRRDELIRWLGAGCVLAAFARVHYLLFPSLYTDYVYTGDVLRAGFYSFLLVGAAREITSFWQARAQAAVLDDRRRIARDLHDGLIQELSYIYAQSQRLSARPGDVVSVERISSAAGRAIDESRRAVATLTRPEDGDVVTVLQAALDELASRYDVTIVAALDPDTETDARIGEALLRITGEAVRNAVRHGHASRVEVVLTASPLSLRVHDDGRGFAVGTAGGARPGGFGLTSMRERAAGVGASLGLESEPGKGTTVQVNWV